MKKTLILVTLALCLALCCTACSATPATTASPGNGKPTASADNPVVAKVGNVEILNSQVLDIFNGYGYPSYLAAYGYEAGSDEYNEAANMALSSILQSMAKAEVVRQAAAKDGLTLTDEEKVTVDTEYQATLGSLYATAKTEAEALKEADDTINVDAKTEELVENIFTEAGYTRDSYKQELLDYALIDKYQSETVKDTTLSEEDLGTRYAELTTTQQTTYCGTGTWDDPEEGYTAADSGVETTYSSSTVAYMPARYTAVTNLVIAFDDETAAAISELQSNAELSTEEIQEQIAELEKTGYNNVKSTVDEVYAKAQTADQTTFNSLITQYGSDSGMTGTALTYGYLVGEDTNYVQSFKEAASAFTAAGEISEAFTSSYGVHILRCVDVFAGGAVPLEQVHDRYKAEADATYQDEFYEEHLTKLCDEMGMELYTDKLTLGETTTASASPAASGEASPTASAEAAASVSPTGAQ